MDELGTILTLAGLCALGFQFSKALRARRLYILVAMSVGFLYTLTSPLYLVAILFWVIAVYWLALRRLSILPLYLFIIVGLFVIMRSGALSLGEGGAIGDYAVPLGFSFLMFQSIGFLKEVRRRGACPGFLPYSAAALFFPTLVMGPFCSNESQRDELGKEERDPWDFFWGFSLIALGLFKYGVASLAADAFLLGSMPLKAEPANGMHSATRLLLASVYFYGNFSGFADMVRGACRTMNIDIPVNFRFPFFSSSPAEYWRHWHITLGLWFREHVFIPLSLAAGRRQWDERFSARAAGLFTFLLIGAWHGLGPKFLLWALVNAVLVVFFHPRSRAVGILATFLLMLMVNGLFLAESLPAFGQILAGLFAKTTGPELEFSLRAAAGGILILGVLFGLERWQTRLEERRSPRDLACAAALSTLLFYLGFLLTPNFKDFVYQGF